MNMTKKALFFCLVLLVLAVIGCGTEKAASTQGEELTAEEIVEAVVATAGNIETVQSDTYMTINMKLRNGEFLEMSVPASMTFISDNVAKEAKLEMSMVLDLPEEQGGRVEIYMETYIVDDEVYTKVVAPDTPDTWVKQNMPLGYWEEQLDQITQEIQLLSLAQVELLASERIDGTEAYVLRVEPDVGMLWERLMQLPALQELVGAEFFDIGEIFKSYSMKEWVAKDTFFPLKSEIRATMVINSENIPSDEKFELTIDVEGITEYYNYNQPVSIELPAEAQDAVEVPFLQ